MSDIEQARKKLKISGYYHPKNIKSIKNNMYKTFNEKNKDYRSSLRNYDYATFTSGSLEIKCPNCKKDALYQCDCVYKDKQCVNGHIWYVDKDGKIVQGDPHC